jgi:hypothetical protein
LRVTTSGGTGDLDLLARFGKRRSAGFLAPCDFDEASWENGNQESVDIADVLPGEWFINLSGYRGLSGRHSPRYLIGPDFSAEGVTNALRSCRRSHRWDLHRLRQRKWPGEEAGRIGAVANYARRHLGDSQWDACSVILCQPRAINAQIPFETKPGEATVVVKSGDMLTTYGENLGSGLGARDLSTEATSRSSSITRTAALTTPRI